MIGLSGLRALVVTALVSVATVAFAEEKVIFKSGEADSCEINAALGGKCGAKLASQPQGPFKTRGLKPVTANGAPTHEAARAEVHQTQTPKTVVIQFDLGSAELTPQGRHDLNQLADALRTPEFANKTFQISGHTDAIGTDEYNQALSENRAASVVTYLRGKGVVANLTSAGFGERDLFDVSFPENPANRRVEVKGLNP